MKIVSGEKMGEIDREAMRTFGIPGIVLMENAGLQVVNLVNKICPAKKRGKILIFCGRGNNGGDGFVISRHLHRQGYNVETWALGHLEEYKGDAALNYNILLKSGYAVNRVAEKNPFAAVGDLTTEDLIIDALLGTGLRRQVDGAVAEIISAINSSKARVLSVDVPSGVSADTGEVMGVAVKADYTVTFALPKRGLLLFPGAEHCGVLLVADIGIPQQLLSQAEIKENLITGAYVSSHLPSRKLDGHKGSAGRVLILAGSPGMSGAAALAGEAALRAGAGLVYVGTAAQLRAVLEAKLKEVIVLGFPDDGRGHLTAQGIEEIVFWARGCQALALGPGLQGDKKTLSLIKKLAGEISIPMVIDAGGLTALSCEPNLLEEVHPPFILTPHPGEMARLLGTDTVQVQKDRWGLAARQAVAWQVVLLLKGAYSVIATPEGEIYINPTGNPVLSTAGTGDLLTGLTAALVAQGLPADKAAVCGAYLHGLAADLLVAHKGARGFIAGDILEFFPAALEEIARFSPPDPGELFPVKPLSLKIGVHFAGA